MARPRVHPFWVDKIRVMVANEPGMSGVEVRRRLANRRGLKDEPTPPTPVPSDRAIRRIMSEFKAAPPQDRLPYRTFSWPESMELGALPWEASRAALDLLRFRTDNRLRPPLIREALWLWRVTQAAPDAPMEARFRVALDLALHAVAIQPSPQTLTAIQWKLAFQPWRSPEDKEAWSDLPSTLRESPPITVGILDALPLFGRLDTKSTPRPKQRKIKKGAKK